MVAGPAAPPTQREIADFVASALRERLPEGWVLSVGRPSSGDGPDLVLSLRAPDGTAASLNSEVKASVATRDVAALGRRLAPEGGRAPDGGGLVASRYLSESVRRRLAELGLSYVDATGNIRVTMSRPGLFLADKGADRDPWRGPGRPRESLRGAPAAKVVRALIDLPGPWRIRELVGASQAATGSAYRVLEYLESESLVERDEGWIRVPRWPELLRAWSKDYGFARENAVTRWIAPRGIERLLDEVRRGPVATYAVTGSLAAGAWAPYAPARSAWLYVRDPREAAEALGLRETDSGANVLLASPAYDVVFERTRRELDGLRLAAPAQVAVDLMTGPGRAPAEAEELVTWMESNEQRWRR
ncbi:hypothetical protein ACH436_07210 [Isoptericola sp. NPDC019693]|uniref:hypothetical protein n=1 Tax=Isoptericola sp. NPDC019693 TaxID=3364009 RepID=UPI0037B4E9E8